MEDYKANKIDFNYKRRGRPKITHFWSPNKGYGKKRRRKEKERKIKRDQAKVWIHDFCIQLYDFWYTNYLGMIF